MTGEPRLFEPAIEAGQMQIHYEWPHGWTVMINVRRSGDTWDRQPAEFYACLSAGELLDTICAAWGLLLET